MACPTPPRRSGQRIGIVRASSPAALRDTARADEREIGVRLAQLLDRIEAEGGVFEVRQFAAGQSHAIVVATPEQQRDAPVVGVDGELVAVGQRPRHRLGRAARIDNDRCTVRRELCGAGVDEIWERCVWSKLQQLITGETAIELRWKIILQ